MCPRKPLKPCGHPNCPNLSDERYCKKHRKQYEKEKGSASERGYDSKWRTARKRYLFANPLCVECSKDKKVVAAEAVDHIIPHPGDKKLFWDKSNWQSLCTSCHNSKTRTQDQTPEYRY